MYKFARSICSNFMVSFFIVCQEFPKYSFKSCINKIEKKKEKRKTLLPMLFANIFFIGTL
jgi:hypothetical protein